MNEKYLKLNKQFENAVSQICQSPDEFNALLRVAAFNYRLTFQNAVLAYAQGTDSDLLLTYEQWQLYGRVAKRHTKATLLYDVNNRNRYVVTFPMSRTVVDKRIHRHKELRFFDYRNDAAVVAALQAIYQTDADNLTEILYAENRQRFESFFDDAYPAFDNEPDFLAKAVTNMLMCRFGEEMPYKSFSFSDGINRDNIEHIYQMVIDVFRAEYAELATSLPIELENVREFTEDDDLPFDDVPVSTDSVTEIKQDVISLFKEKTNGLFHSIDGLSPSEIEQMVKEYAESVFSENEIYAEILGIAISGSRCRGLEHNGSDLDVVIEVQSDTKETALFNLLNERTFEIGGVRVDINPIKADETGTLSEYLPTVEKYLGKIEILDYGKYIIDNRSVFNAKKGSIYTIPIETTPALLRRLEKVGVVPRDEMTDVVFESDNGTWNKLIIPDRYGNKTNSIDISDVLSQEEISAAKKVVADVIEREQSRNETHRSLTKDDVQLLHTIEPRKSVLNFSQDELTLTSVWSERFAAEIGKKSPFYRAENGEWRDHDESKSQIITVEAVETDFKSVRNDIKAQKIKRGITVNEDTHWSIQISRKGLEDSVKYGFTHKNGNIYNLLYAIQNIVANSVLLDSNISEKNNNNKAYNTAFMHKFYTVCRIGDQPVLAKLSVEEFLDGKGSTLKRMYNLQDIKTEPLRHIEFTDNQLARSVLNGSEISVADLFRIVKTLDKDTQLVFCDLSTPSVGKSKTKDFTVYEDLKAKLVYLGIPENEVQFIQHYKSSKAKQKLFSEVRRGKVRVLIGSTVMMGTGMNVQHKLIALHHLDCPNRPTDMEQREGRIIRQGNTNETVQIYNYVTKGTFDAFMYQMVERKQRFISSVMAANHFSERSVEDIDEATLNFGQIKAVASDNPLVMKKFEIDGKVSKLTAIRNEYINEHRRMEDEVQLLLPNTIKKLESLSASYKEDMEFAKSNPTPDPFDIEICGVHYDKRTKALEAIVAQRKNIQSATSKRPNGLNRRNVSCSCRRKRRVSLSVCLPI